jgi:hypothetical protein
VVAATVKREDVYHLKYNEREWDSLLAQSLTFIKEGNPSLARIVH